MKRTLLALQLLLCLFTGCSMKEMVTDNMVPLLKDAESAFNETRSVQAARESAPALLAQLDGFIEAAPDNEELLVLGAKMHTTFAFGFLESAPEDDLRYDALQKWAEDAYARATDYGFRALRIMDPALWSILRDPKQGRKDVAAHLKAEGYAELHPYVFWLSYAWGSWINVNRGKPDAMAELPKIEAMMSWCLEQDEDYYFAGGHLFFGVRYALRVGGDPEKSRKHFERAIEVTEDRFPLARVLWAEKLKVAIQDREGYEKQLEMVIEQVEDYRERLEQAEPAGYYDPEEGGEVPERDYALMMSLSYERALNLLYVIDDKFLAK